MNGIWFCFFFGCWFMIMGWCDLLIFFFSWSKREFVLVDVWFDDLKKDICLYEMLFWDDFGKVME